MHSETLSTYGFDAYYAGVPIGGACAIWLHGSVHVLTAFHVSHDLDRNMAPRALILRNRIGDITLRNLRFAKVRGSQDLALSTPVDMSDALRVARTYVPGDSYITLGSGVSLFRNAPVAVPRIGDMPISMRHAPEHIDLQSAGQRIDFGFSGKPILNSRSEVTAVIVQKRAVRRGVYVGVAETVRQRLFQ